MRNVLTRTERPRYAEGMFEPDAAARGGLVRVSLGPTLVRHITLAQARNFASEIAAAVQHIEWANEIGRRHTFEVSGCEQYSIDAGSDQ